MGASESSGIAERITEAVTPIVGHEGYELILVEYVPHGRVLRVYIDREGGIGIDDCSRVSRVISDVLDAEGISDRIDGRYTLEVSSPGLDRPLVKPRDFQRFIGQQAQVGTREPQVGRRKFTGELVAADDHTVQMRVDGQLVALPFMSIEKARLVPTW